MTWNDRGLTIPLQVNDRLQVRRVSANLIPAEETR
jgi:hypothetical protein